MRSFYPADGALPMVFLPEQLTDSHEVRIGKDDHSNFKVLRQGYQRDQGPTYQKPSAQGSTQVKPIR